MKKKIILAFLCFIFISTLSIGAEKKAPAKEEKREVNSKIRSREDIEFSVEQQIADLENQKIILENLKKALKEKNIDINSPNFNGKGLKVALVLSGGGAKGAAHVGVLKVLEKYKVPIDLVVGTSIGSIVGGMYASGYTPDEIEKLLLGFDMTQISDDPHRNYKNAMQRFEFFDTPLTLKFDKEYNLSIPAGFINGSNIYSQLKNIFARSSQTEYFDNLVIPYRAVTTDIQTGKEVVIDHGDLAMATFKSMAIPGLISPVNDNGKYFIDGGVVNNFPVDVAIEMGADIVIAVDITANSEKIDKNSTVINVIDKIAAYNGDRNTTYNKEKADILIVPNVKSHSTVDFSNLESLIVEGEKSAEDVSTALKKLTDEASFEKLTAKRLKFAKDNKTILIKKITIEGTKILNLETVKKLGPKPDEDDNTIVKYDLTQKQLEEWTSKIASLDYISRVFYRIVDNEVIFTAIEKEGSDLNFALNYAMDIGPALKTSFLLKTFGPQKNLTKVELVLSEYPDISLKNNYLFPVLRHQTLATIEGGYKSTPFIAWDRTNILGYMKNETKYIGISGGFAPSNYSLISLGTSFKDYNFRYHQGDEFLSNIGDKAKYLEYNATFKYDTLDNTIYPNKGNSFYFELVKANNSSKISYHGYLGIADIYYPITKKLTIGGSYEVGKMFSDGGNAPLDEMVKLGGIRNDLTNQTLKFYGLSAMQLVSTDVSIWAINTKYNLVGPVYLQGRYNEAVSKNTMSVSEQIIGTTTYRGYGGGFGLSSFFGPIDLIISNTIRGHGPLYQLYIGYVF